MSDKSIVGAFYYEKQKNGQETVGRVTKMLPNGQVQVVEEKRNMIPLRELKKHLKLQARSDHNMAKANKKVQNELTDMTINVDNGFVETVRIYDEIDPKTGQMRAYFDNDEFVMGDDYNEQIANILRRVPQQDQELVETLIEAIIDQTADACAEAFTEVIGYSNDRIQDEIKKGA